jgi:hypothetical protein
MSDDKDTRSKDPADGEQPAAEAVFSLSQALLAPLDALLKAQVHAARSFLNFLLQLSFPDQGSPPPATNPSGSSQKPPATTPGASGAAPTAPKHPYTVDFPYRTGDGLERVISVPTLALVPVAPLGVTGADFQFDFYVSHVGPHQQTRRHADHVEREPPQTSDDDRRQWYLVDDPLSLRGTFAPKAEATDATPPGQYARFHIEVKVAQLPVPAALEKMLSSLGQLATSNPADKGQDSASTKT